MEIFSIVENNSVRHKLIFGFETLEVRSKRCFGISNLVFLLQSVVGLLRTLREFFFTSALFNLRGVRKIKLQLTKKRMSEKVHHNAFFFDQQCSRYVVLLKM